MTPLAFLPALHGQFLAWDDDVNLVTNEHFRGLGWPQVRWAFSNVRMGHYIPITWLSFSANYAAGGMDPRGYHLVSQLVHATNAIAFYFVARRLLAAARGAQDAQAIVRLESDWLDEFTGFHRRSQVLQLSVDPHRDDVPVGVEVESGLQSAHLSHFSLGRGSFSPPAPRRRQSVKPPNRRSRDGRSRQSTRWRSERWRRAPRAWWLPAFWR